MTLHWVCLYGWSDFTAYCGDAPLSPYYSCDEGGEGGRWRGKVRVLGVMTGTHCCSHVTCLHSRCTVWTAAVAKAAQSLLQQATFQP